MDWTRRNILAAGAAAAATAAVPRVFAQQSGQRGTGKFYERGPVRIYYEEAGSGFPLLLLPGGGLNSTISFFTGNSPFNAIEEFKGEYRCITADLRNAPSGQSTGPSEVARPWDVDHETARDRVADDRPIRHQDVRDRPRFRLHRDTQFRAELPKPDPGPAGRGPRAPIRRRHGVRDARAKGRGEHLSLERTQG